MPETYIRFINMDRSVERRRNIELLLKEANLPSIRFPAIIGQEYSFDSVDNGNRLSAGEKGCALSHRKLLEEFLNNSQAPFALVMEDDIEFDRDFSKVVEKVLKLVDPNKNIYVQFDYAPVGIKGVLLWWFLLSNRWRNQKNSWFFWISLPFLILKGLLANALSLYEGMRDQYYRLRKAVHITPALKDRYLAGCYLVSRGAAGEIVQINTPLKHAADAVHNLVRKKGSIEHYICVPRLVRQKREVFTSTLDNTHFGKKVIAY